MVFGFKAFNPDCTNRYGQVFERGKTYYANCDNIEFQKTGFHFCKNLEDTLRYYDGFSDIKIAKVIGLGKIDEYEDNYYGYYDMYSAEMIYIIDFLSRNEIYQYIFDLAKDSSSFNDRVIRFVSGFKINGEEQRKLIDATNNLNEKKRLVKAIKYYQYNDKNVYNN